MQVKLKGLLSSPRIVAFRAKAAKYLTLRRVAITLLLFGFFSPLIFGMADPRGRAADFATAVTLLAVVTGLALASYSFKGMARVFFAIMLFTLLGEILLSEFFGLGQLPSGEMQLP